MVPVEPGVSELRLRNYKQSLWVFAGLQKHRFFQNQKKMNVRSFLNWRKQQIIVIYLSSWQQDLKIQFSLPFPKGWGSRSMSVRDPQKHDRALHHGASLKHVPQKRNVVSALPPGDRPHSSDNKAPHACFSFNHIEYFLKFVPKAQQLFTCLLWHQEHIRAGCSLVRLGSSELNHICSLDRLLTCVYTMVALLCAKINSEKSSHVSVLLWELCWLSRAQEGVGCIQGWEPLCT